jgi:ParB family transcriptional regulator, chromosome partitioning protein
MTPPSGGAAGLGAAAAGSAAGRRDPDVLRLENELADKLGARVQIQHGADGRGKVVAGHNSLDELDGNLSHIQ